MNVNVFNSGSLTSQPWKTLTLKQLGGETGEAEMKETSERPGPSSSQGIWRDLCGKCSGGILDSDLAQVVRKARIEGHTGLEIGRTVVKGTEEKPT